MDWVRMHHPALPGQVIEVGSTAAPIHEQSGWVALPPDPGEVITRETFIERYGYDPIGSKNG